MEKYTDEEVILLINDFGILVDIFNNDNLNAIQDINDVKLQKIVEKVMQTENQEILLEYMKDVCSNIDLTTISDNTLSRLVQNGMLLELIWGTTEKEVQQAKIQEIINQVKGNDYLVELIWSNADKEVQKANADLLPEIMEQLKNNHEIMYYIWENTDKKVQQAKLEEIIDKVKEDEGLVKVIWERSDKEVQRANEDLLPKIIEQVKENTDLVESIWRDTDKEVQRANEDLLPKIIDQVKENKYTVESIWKNTDKEVKKAKIEEIIDKVKENRYLVGSIWKNTDKEVKKAKIEEIIDKVKENRYLVESIWRDTDKEVQTANEDLLPKIIDQVKENKYTVESIWRATDKEVQRGKIQEIIDQVKENADLVKSIWSDTHKEVQQENLDDVFKIIENSNDKDGKLLRNINSIKAILKSSNPSIISNVWDKLTLEEQKDNLKLVCNRLCENYEASQYLPEFLRKINADINIGKLIEILNIKDHEYLNNYMMDEIIGKNIDTSNVDIENVNAQIDKIHEIFCTSNLPEVFRLYEFFKFHPNYSSNNIMLYKNVSIEDRNKIILQDLFITALDSDNKQLLNFFELFHNGNVSYNKKQNGYELNELDSAILSSYGDALISLYRLYKNEKLDKVPDSSENIDKIRKKLQLDDKADVGDMLLGQFLNKIGFKIEDYQENRESISLNLLNHMEKERKRSIQRNCKQVDVSKLLQER